MSMIAKLCNGIQALHLLKPQVTATAVVTVRHRNPNYPKKRLPFWYQKQNRALYKENITQENKAFVQDIVEHKFGKPTEELDEVQYTSPLKDAPIEPQTDVEWTETTRRTGLIAKKLGVYPMWLKDGRRIATTLLHVIDNHVIKYTPAEEHFTRIHKQPIIKNKLGCLLVGAESIDPQYFTKEYCGLFNDSGVMPKRQLMRFFITPNAALQPGTKLYAMHFKPGDKVDVRSKTIDRGFHGVMKRWGFKGMPATHGQTKTHRRPGCISVGMERGVIKGTKMPGHMGNRYRTLRAQEILRINTKYNVIWIKGQNIPGGTGDFVQIYDTIYPWKKPESPSFPTWFPKPGEPLPEELWSEHLQMYHEPTIMFPVEKK